MSKMTKSNMTVDGNSVHVSMPFAKVDEAQRTVSGWATLDNIDTQKDIVLAEASAKAFARARGNIREMHQPLAVGRMVDFSEDEYFDAESGALYRGIFVTARVSEGAEDTWKKVLDGTLTGFSIGGEINEASTEWVEEAQTTVRFIKDYDLVELSLVDNPANQLANIYSIQKNKSGESVVKGMAVETEIENVFMCLKHDDNVITIKSSEKAECPACGEGMQSAGWFESGGNRTEKVRDIVSKFLNPADKEAAPISESEGGVEMGKKNEVVEKEETPEVDESVETEAPVVEETPAVEEEAVAEVNETEGTEEEEEVETPEEVTDEETEISKKIDELHEAVKTSLEESQTETAEKVSSLEKKIESATEQFLAKATELENKFSEFGNKLEASKSRLAELEGRLEKINSSDALKKSADLSEEPAVKNVQKETSWNGAFSVDNLM